MVAEFTVTGAVPVERRIRNRVVEVLRVTFPKLRLELLTVSSGFKAAVPIPLKVIVASPEEESLSIVICPLAVPVAEG